MAIADMFLKIQGVTGEAGDKQHKGEIEVVSWSWGMQASTSAAPGQASGKATMRELQVVKRVDQSSPTLMKYLRNHKLVQDATLTVRKAGKVGLAVLGSRVLGLVREMVFAHLYGASMAGDAFRLAFRIPNLLRDLFAEGALSTAFVTTFTKTLEKDGEQRAWRLANLVITLQLVVLGAIVVA